MRFALAMCLIGCGDKASNVEDDLPSSSADPGGPAPVVEPSDGECPDLTQSHTTRFSSSGEERVVTVVLPDEPTEDMPLVFFFHGLLDPGSMPVPTEYMADAINLQAVANQAGVAFILPQSGIMERMGFRFFMWAVDEYEGPDVVLFDDLRACAADQLSVDLRQVHAMGVSGGALFTTVILRDRGNTLASMIELSGGSDIEMPTFDAPLSVYETATAAVPALLISGGATDAWPGGGLELVNFTAATDTLEGHLVEDGHFVVRCEHDLGHTVPMTAIAASWDWVETHQFGEPSPLIETGIDDVASLSPWCVVAE